jgi:hypothetical protein
LLLSADRVSQAVATLHQANQLLTHCILLLLLLSGVLGCKAKAGGQASCCGRRIAGEALSQL